MFIGIVYQFSKWYKRAAGLLIKTVGCVLSILVILHSLATLLKISNKRKPGRIDKINTAYSTVSVY